MTQSGVEAPLPVVEGNGCVGIKEVERFPQKAAA
jgi:hypothetical protein